MGLQALSRYAELLSSADHDATVTFKTVGHADVVFTVDKDTSILLQKQELVNKTFYRQIRNVGLFVWLLVFNATFNNISVISWRSVLLMEETEGPRKKPLTCRKSLTNFIT